MESRRTAQRSRKSAAERREEIVAAAAQLALDEGLEQVKLNTVAKRIDVRHGLINYYFPTVEDLVTTAFIRAISEERGRLFRSGASPLERIRHFVAHVQSPEAFPSARLWLNARHLSRFTERLREVLEEQESLDREQLRLLIDDGMVEGVFDVQDPVSASVQILIAVDGYGAYANNSGSFTDPAYTNFVPNIVEWTLGLSRGALTSA